jgi:hypothetical protein
MIAINRKSAKLCPPGNSATFFISAIIGTEVIKKRMPISTLNNVINIIGYQRI